MFGTDLTTFSGVIPFDTFSYISVALCLENVGTIYDKKSSSVNGSL